MKENEEEKLNNEEINNDVEMVELSEDEENDVEGGAVTKRQIVVGNINTRSFKINLKEMQAKMPLNVIYNDFNKDSNLHCIVDVTNGKVEFWPKKSGSYAFIRTIKYVNAKGGITELKVNGIFTAKW